MIVCSVPSARLDGAVPVSLVVVGNAGGIGGVGVTATGDVDVTAGAGTFVFTGNSLALNGGGPVSIDASFFAWSVVFLHPAINSAPKSTTCTAKMVNTAMRIWDRPRAFGSAPCGISGLGVFIFLLAQLSIVS